MASVEFDKDILNRYSGGKGLDDLKRKMSTPVVTPQGIGAGIGTLVNAGKNDIRRVKELGGYLAGKAGEAATGITEGYNKAMGKTVKPADSQTTGKAGDQTSLVSSEASVAAAKQNASIQDRFQTRDDLLQQAAAARVNRPDQAGLSNVDVIRGTNAETVRTGGGNKGSDIVDELLNQGREFVAYGTNPDMKTAIAQSEADAIRRHVFHRPGDSDAVRTAREQNANTAADKYFANVTGAEVDKERNAVTEKLGMANVGARYNETASREAIANQSNLTDRQIAELGLGGTETDAVSALANQRAQAAAKFEQQLAAIYNSGMDQKDIDRAISQLTPPPGYGIQ